MLIHNSCAGWEKGLGGAQIDNSNGECRIESPKYCELQIRRGMFDLNMLMKKCSASPMKVDKSAWPKALQERKNVKRIGVSRVEHYPNSAKCNEDKYMKKVRSDWIDMDDPSISDETKSQIEITIDLEDDDRHLINIDLKRNETRAQELKEIRKKILEQDKVNGNEDRIDHNVIVFYFDHLSRANFHRQLKKFSEWLGKFTSDKNAPLQISEYFRYHTVSKTTLKGNDALFFGYNEMNNADGTQSVYEYFSRNGYVTGAFYDI